ncbi:hypothetical protein RND71_003124 [Anisodus tanguticus]|uniref:WAT1-related protein n=1 Tax=Anisodus tanguticus TaxID=243964 RepID=A0AAE1SSQ9_9SOLA|nr:hypothetical protein RND71_003124 [Anisodus tanguticus]
MVLAMQLEEVEDGNDLVGSIIIVVGFYSVIWGKAKEWKMGEKSLESNNNNMPLLQDRADDPEVNM